MYDYYGKNLYIEEIFDIGLNYDILLEKKDNFTRNNIKLKKNQYYEKGVDKINTYDGFKNEYNKIEDTRKKGNAKGKISATIKQMPLNDESSRSHLFIILKVEDGGKIIIIDMAGSESFGDYANRYMSDDKYYLVIQDQQLKNSHFNTKFKVNLNKIKRFDTFENLVSGNIFINKKVMSDPIFKIKLDENFNETSYYEFPYMKNGEKNEKTIILEEYEDTDIYVTGGDIRNSIKNGIKYIKIKNTENFGSGDITNIGRYFKSISSDHSSIFEQENLNNFSNKIDNFFNSRKKYLPALYIRYLESVFINTSLSCMQRLMMNIIESNNTNIDSVNYEKILPYIIFTDPTLVDSVGIQEEFKKLKDEAIKNWTNGIVSKTNGSDSNLLQEFENVLNSKNIEIIPDIIENIDLGFIQYNYSNKDYEEMRQRDRTFQEIENKVKSKLNNIFSKFFSSTPSFPSMTYKVNLNNVYKFLNNEGKPTTTQFIKPFISKLYRLIFLRTLADEIYPSMCKELFCTTNFKNDTNLDIQNKLSDYIKKKNN